MAAHLLQFEHDSGERLISYWLARRGVADLVILAVDAPEIAGGKEDCTRAPPSLKGRLFAMMGNGRVDDHPCIEPAESLLAGRTVRPAHLRAEDATLQAPFEQFNLPDEITRINQAHFS
jgi:hypothetical protein